MKIREDKVERRVSVELSSASEQKTYVTLVAKGCDARITDAIASEFNDWVRNTLDAFVYARELRLAEEDAKR